MSRKSFGGLDLFRFLAAFLVISIHVSPLSSLSSGADFFLTRILARLAVPPWENRNARSKLYAMVK